MLFFLRHYLCLANCLLIQIAGLSIQGRPRDHRLERSSFLCRRFSEASGEGTTPDSLLRRAHAVIINESHGAPGGNHSPSTWSSSLLVSRPYDWTRWSVIWRGRAAKLSLTGPRRPLDIVAAYFRTGSVVAELIWNRGCSQALVHFLPGIARTPQI